MKAVTVLGVAGIFEDQLDALMGYFRNETGDQGWHIHVKRLPSSQYSMRVYAPDRHSQLHDVAITSNSANDIWDILVNEATSWQLRVQPVLMATDEATIEQRPHL
jgi:hypothetical protein